MRTYYIYKATNKINGKSYIGQTVDLKRRKREHLRRRYASGYKTTFQKEIDEYGEENFEWKIIASYKDKQLADREETKQILLYDTLEPNGYNSMVGGGGGSRWRGIPVVCLTFDGKFVKRYESASEAEDDGFYYGSVLDSCRDPYIQAKGYIFMFEDDYINNGARKKLDKEIPDNATEIYQCDMNGNLIKKYPMISIAEKETGINHSRIIGCASGRDKSAKGYIFVYPEDFPIKDIESHKKKVKGVKVAKLDKDTEEVLAVYDRMSDAARELGGSHKVIWKAVKGQTKTAYGFKWKSIS